MDSRVARGGFCGCSRTVYCTDEQIPYGEGSFGHPRDEILNFQGATCGIRRN